MENGLVTVLFFLEKEKYLSHLKKKDGYKFDLPRKYHEKQKKTGKLGLQLTMSDIG